MIKRKRERFLIISNHRVLPPPPDVTHDGDETHEEWEVEEILRSRWKDRKNKKNEEYFVKWKGYGAEHNGWVSPDQASQELARRFVSYVPTYRQHTVRAFTTYCPHLLLHTVRIVCN
jgi:hypothetical protein